MASVSGILQLFTGHHSAKGVSINQPAKLAAFEGHYDSFKTADMYLLGIVNQDTKKVTGLKIPNGLSFLLYYDFTTPVKGLNAFPDNDRPKQVNAIFQTYHLMVAMGIAMIVLTLVALHLWWKGNLFKHKWIMLVFLFSVLLPQLANQLGWFSAEMGRQPWVVYGLLRTSDALSKAVRADQVIFSLVLFTFIYLVLFILFIYLLNKKIQHGFEEHIAEEIPEYSKRNNPILN